MIENCAHMNNGLKISPQKQITIDMIMIAINVLFLNLVVWIRIFHGLSFVSAYTESVHYIRSIEKHRSPIQCWITEFSLHIVPRAQMNSVPCYSEG